MNVDRPAPEGTEAGSATAFRELVSWLELLARAAIALTAIGALPVIVGAVFIFSYFVQIGYVPAMGLTDLMTLLIASAGVGTPLLLVLALVPWTTGTLRGVALNAPVRASGESLEQVVDSSVVFALLVFALQAHVGIVER